MCPTTLDAMYVYNDLPDNLSWPLRKKIAYKVARLYERLVAQVKSLWPF